MAAGRDAFLGPAFCLCILLSSATAHASHRHSIAGHKAHQSQVEHNLTQEKPRPGGGIADQISGNDLVRGLPQSWRATLLDTPALPSSASHVVDRNTTRNSVSGQDTAGLAAASRTGEISATSMVSQERVLLPIPAKAGIAAFESGDRFIIIVDNAIPMDTTAIHGDGIFSSLSVSLLPDATMIQMRRPDTRQIFLSQQSDGWVLGLTPPIDVPQRDRRTINPLVVKNGVLYPMRRSGRVLAVSDPASGARLLVGTSLLDDGGIATMRRTPSYDVWPTNEGVVVSARDADINLYAVPSGLLLNRDGHRMTDDGQAVYANDVDLRWLALQNRDDVGLRQRFHDAFFAAADSSPATRFDLRIKEAQAAFSMGAFPEARGILSVALMDDPEEIARPEVRFLAAATALMNGDLDDASALDGPWPEGQQRAVQLWRALYLAQTDESNDHSVHRLVLDLDRLKSYPTDLRDTLLPIATEAIARGATASDLPVLNKLPQASPFQLARALANTRLGKTDAARRIFDRLKTDRDPVIAEKAVESEITLDHMQGRLTPQQTIHSLDSIILDARLAGRETAVRLAQAEAFLQIGDWQNAVLMIDQGVPPGHPSRHMSQRSAILIKSLKGLAELPTSGLDHQQALRNAALLKAHIPQLPAGFEQANLQVAYGKLLLSIGLTDDGTRAIETAIPALDGPNTKAAAGLALAQAAIQRKDAAGGLQALSTTDDDALSPEIRAQRDVAKAEIALLNGNTSQSLDILKNAQTTSARLITIRTFENQGDWASATREFRVIAQDDLPVKGELSDAQRDLALRFASDASRAGDTSALRWLSNRVGNRMLSDSRSRLFSVLTQPTSSGGLATSNE